MISALTSHLHTLHLSELTDSLRLCSKILSKVQPPLLSAGMDGTLQLPSGHSSSIKEWENKKVSDVILSSVRGKRMVLLLFVCFPLMRSEFSKSVLDC